MKNQKLSLAVLITITLGANAAGAATHIFINPDVFTGTSSDRAFVDISGEPRVANVRIVSYSSAGANEVTVPMNDRNFATSPNLFGLSTGHTALIVAQTTDPSAPSVAVLRQQYGSFKSAVTIPSSNRMLGQSFNLPLGDLYGGANLYLGNPSGTDANVVVQFGNSTFPADAIVRVPAVGVVKVPISSTHAQTNMLITVTNAVPIVAQAVIGAQILIVPPITSATAP